MTSLIEQLRSRVEQTRKELEEARKRLREAQTHEQMLQTELNGYQKASEAELRREGKRPSMPTMIQAFPVQGAGPPTGVRKTDFVRSLLKDRGQQGVTPVDVWAAFKKTDQYTKMHRNYVYAILARLKDRGEVVERNGKYFPVPQSGAQGSSQ